MPASLKKDIEFCSCSAWPLISSAVAASCSELDAFCWVVWLSCPSAALICPTPADASSYAAVGQINCAVGQLSQTTQQNASSSEQLAATAEEMSGQAEQLQNSMSFFKLAGISQGHQVGGRGQPARAPRKSAAYGFGNPRVVASADIDEAQFVKF